MPRTAMGDMRRRKHDRVDRPWKSQRNGLTIEVMVELFWISLLVGLAVVTVSAVALWGASGARLMSSLAAIVGVAVIVASVIVQRVWGADSGVVSIVSSMIAGIGLAHLALALILFWFARYLDRHGPTPPPA